MTGVNTSATVQVKTPPRSVCSSWVGASMYCSVHLKQAMRHTVLQNVCFSQSQVHLSITLHNGSLLYGSIKDSVFTVAIMGKSGE